jgi:two-component system phosphate regulon response regulator OmpR
MESHILVVDDDNRIRELLKRYLSKSGFIVSGASRVKQAVELMGKYIFDILIVDNMMPDETGMEFLQKLRQAENFVPVIMLTALGEVENKIDGLSAGADDYVCKPFEPKELILRINNILKRTQVKSENVKLFCFDKYAFDFEKNELLKDNNELVKLTDIDVKILKLFMKNTNKVLSREKVCKLINNTNERTLDVQITRLRRKIEEDAKTPRILKTIRNKGYIFNV